MTVTEPTDVVELLIGQHMRIRELFAEVTVATGEARQEAFQQLVRLLAVHETAEEEVIHPLARRLIDGGHDIVDERLEEEKQAKRLLKKLESLGTDHAEFPELLARLRADVLAHAHYEEQYEFRYLKQKCEPKQLRALVRAVEIAEKTAPTHPHPGNESMAGNIAAGPIVGLYDQVKDAVHDAVAKAKS